MTFEFQRTISIPDLGDAEATADFSADPESGIVHLEALTIGRLTLSGAQVEDMVGPAHFERCVELAQRWWTIDGWNAALQGERVA